MSVSAFGVQLMSADHNRKFTLGVKQDLDWHCRCIATKGCLQNGLYLTLCSVFFPEQNLLRVFSAHSENKSVKLIDFVRIREMSVKLRSVSGALINCKNKPLK